MGVSQFVGCVSWDLATQPRDKGERAQTILSNVCHSGGSPCLNISDRYDWHCADEISSFHLTDNDLRTVPYSSSTVLLPTE